MAEHTHPDGAATDARLFHALEAALGTFLAAERTTDLDIVKACGALLAGQFALFSAAEGDTVARLEERLTAYAAVFRQLVLRMRAPITLTMGEDGDDDGDTTA